MWLNSPEIMEFRLHENVVNSLIFCAKEARASIVQNIEWLQLFCKIMKNCILSKVCGVW